VTLLKNKIVKRIKSGGPLTIADYMSMCLGDPEHGYYTTRQPFGRSGDFITAPEVSQMFGELVGAACLDAYERMGSPETVQLVELGPGRGTLMADFLRVATRRPAFVAAARLNLVEMSPRLRQIQAGTLQNSALKPAFHDDFSQVPDGPLIVIANEFFDALPIHQFIKTSTGWQERVIGLTNDGALAFGAGAAQLPEATVPGSAKNVSEGAVLETQPTANAIMEAIASRVKDNGGAALIVDYGYAKTAPGDTLQALLNHAFDDVLAHPGEADLTAHVNFEALASAARSGGAVPLPLLTQGDFLLRTGLLERARALGAGKSPKEQNAIRDAVERLAAPGQMGDLFKVLAITPDGAPFAPFDPVK